MTHFSTKKGKMREKTKHLFRGPEFKLKVLSYYYSHGKNAKKTREKYSLNESTLRTWIRNTPIDEKSVSLHSELTKAIMKDDPNDDSPEQNLETKIDELEKALAYERMRSRAYEKLIEIAEAEEGISILKKDGAKQ